MYLGRFFGLNVNGGWVVFVFLSFDKLVLFDRVVLILELVLFYFILNTWD